ncbi:MAG: sulfatase-like hydrolase/transferase [Planctomycetota bacterium]
MTGAIRERRARNVLFVMTDQQSADAIGSLVPGGFLETPNLDRLIGEGVRFTRAYTPNPLCAPARASVFTGRYPHEHGIQTNDDAHPTPFACLGRRFADAGFRTGYYGKWHLPWDAADTDTHGFAEIDNVASANGADPRTPGLATDFLRRDTQQPFLLVASFNNPHNVCEWARGDRDMPDGSIGPVPPIDRLPPALSNDAPPIDEPDIVAAVRRSMHAHPLFPVGGFGQRDWRELIWAYYRMIEHVDRGIGVVLDALRDSGRADETLVVFTSDHGDCRGAHAFNQKTVFYEESSRVPLIVRGPGVAAGAVDDRLVNIGVDMMPTMLAAAGVPNDADLPGRDLFDDALPPRDCVVCENHAVQTVEVYGWRPTPRGRMVRSDRFKYCLYDQGERRESLVDLLDDPGETVNLAPRPEMADVVAQHRRMLGAFAEVHGDDTAAAMLASRGSGTG